MWLGRILNEAGLTAFPSSRAEEAVVFVQTANPPEIDLLIANLELPGSRDLLRCLAARGGKFRVIAIGGAGSAGRRKIYARLQRPKGRATPSPAHFLRIIRGAL